MIRTAPAVLLLAVAASAQAPVSGSGERARAAAGGFAALTVAEAEPTGGLRWVVWGEGRGDGRSEHLALFRVDARQTTRIWATAWPDGYLPRLNTDTRWRNAGRPVAVSIVQFGAGAVEVNAWGLQADDQPRALLKREAVEAEWRRAADGRAILVLVDRGPSGGEPVARCFGWLERLATVTPTRCPR